MKGRISSMMMVAVSLSSCTGTSEPPPAAATATDVGTGAGVEHPVVQGSAASRSTLRLTVDQLAAAVSIVAGRDLSGNPITWTVTTDGREVDAFSDRALGSTLGRPDYVSVTTEPAEASSLYVKFMDDMARDVCPKILEADNGRSTAASRTLLRFVEFGQVTDNEAILENLRYLVLRFHGQVVTGDEEVADLKSIFDATVSASTAGDDIARSVEAWNAVCVALYVSPAFHIY